MVAPTIPRWYPAVIRLPYAEQFQQVNYWRRQSRADVLEDGRIIPYTYEVPVLAAKTDTTVKATPLRFSYPADHPLAAEFEEQFCGLQREYKGEGEYLSVQHPDDDPSARDDAPDATSLMVFAKDEGQIGELLVA